MEGLSVAPLSHSSRNRLSSPRWGYVVIFRYAWVHFVNMCFDTCYSYFLIGSG